LVERTYLGIQKSPVTLTNILSNGALAPSAGGAAANGWQKNTTYYTYTNENGYLKVQLTSTYNSDAEDSGSWYNAYQTFTTISGNTAATKQVVYFRAKIKVGAGTVLPPTIFYYHASGSWTSMDIRGLDEDGWSLVSGYDTTYDSSTGTTKSFSRVGFGFQHSRSVHDGYYEEFCIKEFMVINLTNDFGAGNEPSWRWCDRNISFFEGTKTTNSAYVYLKNLIPDSSVEQGNWTYGQYSTSEKLYGSRSQYFPAGAGKTQQIAISTMPIVGHKYYGRHYLKTNGEVTAVDCRFEWFAGDGEGLNYVFGWNRGNYPDWTMESSIVEVSAVNGSSYVCRSFVVQGSNNLWADGLMIIDLTEAFGAGNEPNKNWCDNNIPYFDGYTYIEGPTARNWSRAKNIYIGINNVARKIIKGYIGVNGVARKIYGRELRKYGVGSIGTARSNMASTTVGNYAIFAGGTTGSSSKKVTTVSASDLIADNSTLTLDTARSHPVGVSFNNYAMIAGGTSGALLYPIQTGIEIYNSSLVKQSTINMDVRRAALAGGVVGSYAVFSGGSNNTTSQNDLYKIEAFDTSFVKVSTTIDNLNKDSDYYGTEGLTAVSSGNYIVFAGGVGGNSGGARYDVEAYNSLLQKTTCANMSFPVGYLSGAYFKGNYIFAGGAFRTTDSSGQTSDYINIYNSSLVKQTSILLPRPANLMGCAVIDDYLVFAGGRHGYRYTYNDSIRLSGAMGVTNVINVYNQSLILCDTWSLSGNGTSNNCRSSMGATSLNNYVMFAGGSGYSAALDVFVLD